MTAVRATLGSVAESIFGQEPEVAASGSPSDRFLTAWLSSWPFSMSDVS
jgi:hypothetical protein